MEIDRNPLKTVINLRNLVSLRPYWYSYAAKRLMDTSAAILGLLLLAPFFALLAIMIKRDSPGPRMGKGGRVFGILKFRTMHDCPASYQGPRVTAGGMTASRRSASGCGIPGSTNCRSA